MTEEELNEAKAGQRLIWNDGYSEDTEVVYQGQSIGDMMASVWFPDAAGPTHVFLRHLRIREEDKKPEPVKRILLPGKDFTL